jgi:hypothetical protein
MTGVKYFLEINLDSKNFIAIDDFSNGSANLKKHQEYPDAF